MKFGAFVYLKQQVSRFEEILKKYGPSISAVFYDSLQEQHPSRRSLEVRFGLSWNQLKEQTISGKIYELLGEDTPKEVGRKEELEKGFSDESGFVTTRSWKIKTVEDALEKAEIDLKVWEVERYLINSWEVTMGRTGSDTGKPETYTNWQVKVWLKRKKEDPSLEAIKNIIQTIPTFPYNDPPKFSAPSGICLEIAPVDAHFAKLAWAKETGRRDYDLNIAVRDYQYVIEQNLSYASPFSPEKIILVVGNDLMHVENYEGVTPIGRHVLDVDSRLPKIIEAALETNIKMVYLCRSVAPTEIIWVPGNHDPHASLYLCMMLREHFRNDPYVTVDLTTTKSKRKARLWGKLLVGWTHEITGRHSDWANELAQAFPTEWGQSVWREWHHGHKHKKNEIKTFPIMTHGGVLCRQLTALSPIDAWHFEGLFTDAVPGGESFLWSKDYGVIANFVAWTGTGIIDGGELCTEHGIHMEQQVKKLRRS